MRSRLASVVTATTGSEFGPRQIREPKAHPEAPYNLVHLFTSPALEYGSCLPDGYGKPPLSRAASKTPLQPSRRPSPTSRPPPARHSGAASRVPQGSSPQKRARSPSAPALPSYTQRPPPAVVDTSPFLPRAEVLHRATALPPHKTVSLHRTAPPRVRRPPSPHKSPLPSANHRRSHRRRPPP